jgi:ABC-type transporter Mla subunit MlaD
MFTDDLRRLAEEISSAYEGRVQGIADLKRETAEKLTNYRSDMEESNRDRARTVRAELKDMGDSLRSELKTFSTQLAGFKSKLDGEEKDRKDDTRVEIAERSRHIKGLRDDTRDLVDGFENARKEMWRNMKSQLQDFTSMLAQVKEGMVHGNRERIDSVGAELKEMGDNLRSELKGFMSMLNQFKEDLDKAESDRKEEALAGIAERKQDLHGILGGTQDLLKAFGNARKEMWADLKGQLDAFTSELGQFKADLDKGESARKEVMGGEISDRREHIGNLKGDTRNLMTDFENARKEMWHGLKSELETFTTGLAQFKADLETGEKERLETVVREMNDKARELKANLKNFSADLSTTVAQMMGELKKDRSGAAQAWHQILSTMRSHGESMVITTPVPVDREVERKMALEIVEEKALEEEPVLEAANKTGMEELKEKAEEEPETNDDRKGNIPAVLELLEDNPEGLRMVEIADILGFDNWRSLIPIMREVLDDGKVKKEDSTYFAI